MLCLSRIEYSNLVESIRIGFVLDCILSYQVVSCRIVSYRTCRVVRVGENGLVGAVWVRVDRTSSPLDPRLVRAVPCRAVQWNNDWL